MAIPRYSSVNLVNKPFFGSGGGGAQTNAPELVEMRANYNSVRQPLVRKRNAFLHVFCKRINRPTTHFFKI
jgi:hypothetical protein